jgi:DNA-directed RNA polymerase specialized sigma24 family protein
MSAQDREILVMRHLEQLQINEIATILGISEDAVMMRRLRAFRQLRQLMCEDQQEER